MQHLILLRFGELWLKSEGVKKRFLSILRQNIRNMLDAEGVKYSLAASRARFFVETDDLNKTIPALKRVFGITSLSPVVKTDVEEIEREAMALAEKIGKNETFAVRARREGTHPFTSTSLERDIGAKVVEKYGLKVNLTKPDKTIHIEVREKDAYIYSGVIEGASGLPLGAEGKVLGLLTKDAASAAATWLIMRRGARAIAVLHEPGAEKNLDILRNFDPKIKVAEGGSDLKRIAEKHGAKAVVVPEQIDSVGKYIDAEKARPLAVFRPLVGMGDKKVKEILERMN